MAKERKKKRKKEENPRLLVTFSPSMVLLPVCSESAHSSGLPPCRTQVPVSSSSPSLKIILTLVMIGMNKQKNWFLELDGWRVCQKDMKSSVKNYIVFTWEPLISPRLYHPTLGFSSLLISLSPTVNLCLFGWKLSAFSVFSFLVH